MSKAQFREESQQWLLETTQKEIETMSEHIVQKVMLIPGIQSASTLCLYIPLQSEVNMLPLISQLADTVRFAIPYIKEGKSGVCVYDSYLPLEKNEWGILQPQTIVPVEEPIDYCIVPGLAFGRKGERIGRGKGWYDTYLSSLSCTTIGVCFSEQLKKMLPQEEHDQKMDYVVTEHEIINCKRGTVL